MLLDEIVLHTTIGWLILSYVIYLCAFPTTKFAKWGEQKFGSYDKFLNTILTTFITPIIIAIVYFLIAL